MNYELKPGYTSVMFSIGDGTIVIDGEYSTDDADIMGILDVTFADAVQRVAPVKSNHKDSK